MQAFLGGFDRDLVWGLRDYTAACVMLETGARVGEICNLEESDFKWDVGLVNLDGKTGERLVPFDKERIETLIKNWLRIRPRYATKVFISRYGGNTTPDTFRQAFADNLKNVSGLRASLGKNTISCHTLRHFYCTHYLVNGGSLHNLQRITGHKDVNTLMIYVNLANQIPTVREEANRVSPLKSLLDKEPMKKRKTVKLG